MTRLWIALLLTATLAACGGRSDEPVVEELDTVEVGAGQDDEIDLTGDFVGRRTVETVSGVLPGDFPAGLPVYEPSSIVDFYQAGDGSGFVLFATSASPAAVRRWLDAALPAAGWRVGRTETGALDASRAGYGARISVGEVAGTAEIRVEYRRK